MAKSHSIAQAKYDSTHCKYYTLKMNLVNDSDIIEKLEQEESKQGYIKRLIRADIDGASVPIPMCEAARQMLQETADKKNIDVCDLAKLIISEWLVRNSIRT